MTDDLKKKMLSKPTDVQLDEYFSEKPSENPEFQDLLRRTLIHYSREDARKGLAFLMSALKYMAPVPSMELDILTLNSAHAQDVCYLRRPSPLSMSSRYLFAPRS